MKWPRNYLMRPLGNIENALHDAGKGASPALLNHEPTASKPTDTTRENVQAMLAIAVDLLMAAQIGKDVAIRWIARECRVQGAVDVDGGAITTKQINGWRTEIKKQARILAEPGRQTSQKQRAPVTTAKEYADLKKLPEHAAILKGPHDASKRQHAEARARALIRTIAALMPRSAPRQQRRASGAAHDLRDPCRLSQTARAGRF